MAQKAGIIVAAGRGERMGAQVNKVYLPLLGRPLILYSADIFEASSLDCFVIVAHPQEVEFCRVLFGSKGYRKLAGVVPGGESRQDSVAAGLKALPKDSGIVAVHDGARPLVTSEILEKALETASQSGAVVVGVPAKETVKLLGEKEVIRATPDRKKVVLAQTPQVFSVEILNKAYALAREEGFHATDDSSLVEHLGISVKFLQGREDNIKVTTPEDLELAAVLLERRRGKKASSDKAPVFPRVGMGYDVHPFQEDRPLILGGVVIPEGPGLAGYSDADVVLHALIDACLGAAGLPDIGRQFAPGDPSWKNASSLALLCATGEILARAGYRVAQTDMVIAAETPRLSPYANQMKMRIAAVLGLPENSVGIKATTVEGLGFVGRREGIAAWAVATVIPL